MVEEGAALKTFTAGDVRRKPNNCTVLSPDYQVQTLISLPHKVLERVQFSFSGHVRKPMAFALWFSKNFPHIVDSFKTLNRYA